MHGGRKVETARTSPPPEEESAQRTLATVLGGRHSGLAVGLEASGQHVDVAVAIEVRQRQGPGRPLHPQIDGQRKGPVAAPEPRRDARRQVQQRDDVDEPVTVQVRRCQRARAGQRRDRSQSDVRRIEGPGAHQELARRAVRDERVEVPVSIEVLDEKVRGEPARIP